MTNFREARLPFGAQKGKLVVIVLLQTPDFIAWLARQKRLPQFARTHESVDSAIAVFDRRPFSAACFGHSGDRRCVATATRFSLCGDSPDAYFWCERCDPWQRGAAGAMTIGRTYREALRHVEWSCAGRRSDYRELIESVAAAKGLRRPWTEKKVLDFFDG